MSRRGLPSLDADREAFLKHQLTSMQKALTTDECATKEKHIRSLLMGTVRERGARTFWQVVKDGKVRIETHPTVAWKFCHVLHKLLREGHPRVIKDSMHHKNQLKSFAEYWKFNNHGFGGLIYLYLKALVARLDLHDKYNKITGSLSVTEGMLEEMCGSDINYYFSLGVDILECMETQLLLQKKVFETLNFQIAFSNTAQGQCRIAPLTTVIMDTSQLYDATIKVLFKLHSSLAPDVLQGHRDRFNKCHHAIKKFYHICSNFDYFRRLLNIPDVPDRVPDFFVQSDGTHELGPIQMNEEEEPPVEEPPQIVSNLIDTSEETISNHAEELNEKDAVIQSLKEQVFFLQREVEKMQSEHVDEVSKLLERIKNFEEEKKQDKETIEELRKQIEDSLQQIQSHKLQVDSAKSENQKEIEALEKKAQTNENLFKKLKEKHMSLVESHAALLRKNAETKKQAESLQKSSDNLQEAKEEQVKKVEDLKNEVKSKSEELVLMETLKSEQEQKNEVLMTEIEKLKTEKEEQAASLKSEIDTANAAITEGQKASDAATKENEAQKEQSRQIIEDLNKNVSDMRVEMQDRDALVAQLQAQLQQMKIAQQEQADKLDEVTREKEDLVASRSLQEQQNEKLLSEVASKEEEKKRIEMERRVHIRKMIYAALEESREQISQSLVSVEAEGNESKKCSASSLIQIIDETSTTTNKFNDCLKQFTNSKDDIASSEQLIKVVNSFGHWMSNLIANGHATCNMAAHIDTDLDSLCKNCGNTSINFLSNLNFDNESNVFDFSDIENQIEEIKRSAKSLLPRGLDQSGEDIADVFEVEFEQTSREVEQARDRFEKMLEEARMRDEGVKLDVNERILNSCTDLMKYIQALVMTSGNLQKEIVDEGRGASSTKDFYLKNSQWTEGLLSAAQFVGNSATQLTDAANDVVTGKGSFSKLEVCSSQIMETTVQLVAASRVKASKGSKSLQLLEQASGNVNKATGNVVATAKHGYKTLNTQLHNFNLDNATLMQIKKKEVDQKVRINDLEKELELESEKMRVIRKKFYEMEREKAEKYKQEKGDVVSDEQIAVHAVLTQQVKENLKNGKPQILPKPNKR